MSFAINLARWAIPVALIASAPAMAAESPDLAKLKAHLSSVQTMTAKFTQTDAKGRVETGTLQMKRPGRVRFEYSGGDVLLVADGKRLTFLDYQVGRSRAGRCRKRR